MRYHRKIDYQIAGNATFAPRNILRFALVLITASMLSTWFLNQPGKHGSTSQNSAPTPDPPLERLGIRPFNRGGVQATAPELARLPFEPKVPDLSSGDVPLADLAAVAAVLNSETVRSGDTLAKIFARIGFSQSVMAEILNLPEAAKALKALQIGSFVKYRGDSGLLSALSYSIDDFTTLNIVRGKSGFTSSVERVKPDVRSASAMGTITRSLFQDLQDSGVPERVILDFAELFGWDVDFVRDVRHGDRFKIIYQEIFRDNEKVRSGRILAAEFTNGTKEYSAYFYESGPEISGYYSKDGEALKKAFLIAPLNFTKVSSRFNLGRLHPILNKIRAHKGVDYAAPMGTPVRSVANGSIEFAGVQSGYGNVLVIKHGEHYSTLYGHLMKFASGISRGDSVKQGQLIAYVGKTGLATGPHLHYEFRINGAHVDPLTVKLPHAVPLEKRYLADFRRQIDGFSNRLASMAVDKQARNRAVVSKASGYEKASSN